ncbi:MAG: phytoene desaturase family protein [Flavobacteriales bacterium]
MNKFSAQKVVIIGSGFSGLSTACHLASKGFQVSILEKNEQVGGRARLFEEKGYRFDMGPSWYWMPDVFENFFSHFGHSVADYYQLVRLDPSYQIFFGKDDIMSLPASMQNLESLFESIETGAGKKLQLFMKDAGYKYKVAMSDLIYKSGSRISDYLNAKVLGGLVKTDILRSFSSYARKYFKDPRLLQIIEFPVLFLGASPDNIPALYSLMNYADMQLGTWYPMGGMHKIVEAMHSIAVAHKVDVQLNSPVEKIVMETNGRAKGVIVNGKFLPADIIVAGADYQHVEQHLLDAPQRFYSAEYWNKRTLAPSSLIYYLGVKKKIEKLKHHNLFFDADMHQHAHEIYTQPAWPSRPLFYVSCPSKTDPGVAPENCENLFILIPAAPGLSDSPEIKEKYFNIVMDRLEKQTGESIRPFIEYKHSYAQSDFISDYNAFKGNAYGLANTLRQTAFLKPSMRSKKVHNLFYTGQLTVPGPGVPPAIISGQIAADEIIKTIKPFSYETAI